MATVAGVSALIVGGMSVPQASADGSTCQSVYVSNPGPVAGTGCFVGHGDKITVDDRAADGMRVVVDWKTVNGRTGECHNAMGAGNFTVICDYNLPESDRISFRVCTRNGENGANHRCTFWSAWISVSTGDYS